MTSGTRDDRLKNAATSTTLHPTSRPMVDAERSDPLSKCVEDALVDYLKNMDGHKISNLYELVLEEVERPLFETVMNHTSGNLSQAAKILGLTRATLRKRLASRGIDRST